MRIIVTAALAASLTGSYLFTPAPAQAIKVYAAVGTVQHVSTDNIKIFILEERKVESFIVIPKFKNLFSKDGKTTYQMADLRPGMLVDVHYSVRLGIRHATDIYVLNAHGHVLRSVKS